MALPHRALFRRLHKDFIVVRRIRMSAQSYLEPGHAITAGDYPGWRIRTWYQRGFIGVAGDAWTDWTLERFMDRLQREAESVVAGSEPDDRPDRIGALRRLIGSNGASDDDEDESAED